MATAAQRAPAPRPDQLRVAEIFHSIQGEAASSGWPTVFVRLTGCPLRCTWCDTEYAFHGGRWMRFEEIEAEVAGHRARHVCVTGGEPLAQKRCPELLRRLCDAGYEVSLETSGALDVSAVDPRVRRVVDVKAPGSGEAARNRWENLALLGAGDQLKFVLAGRRDYEWAVQVLRERPPPRAVEVLFSPVWDALEPAVLAQWILDDRLPVRFQLQLHKLLWGEERGR